MGLRTKWEAHGPTQRLATWPLSELHSAQTVEQRPGVLLVTGLTRVVGAQGHAADAGQLLSRNLGILLAVELLPEILVQPAAIHLGLRCRRSGHHAERHEADECRPEHLFLRWLVLGFALGIQQSQGCCRPAKVTRRFRVNCQGEDRTCRRVPKWLVRRSEQRDIANQVLPGEPVSAGPASRVPVERNAR